MKALRGQRLKWQTGTIQDIIRFGINRLTLPNWIQQVAGLFFFCLSFMWPILMVWGITHHVGFTMNPLWLFMPLLGLLYGLRCARRVPHRDKWDVLIAMSLVINEIYAWIRMWWLANAWREVLWSKARRVEKDRWGLQYKAEGVDK